MPKKVADKNDWIKLGYDRFTEMGEAGIVIEKLAQQLKCNKSSFYWHFKTKKAFIEALADYWVSVETEQIIQQVTRIADPRERLDKFLAIAFRKGPYLEFVFFLKRYAVKHTTIQEVIDRVDARRLAFSADLLHSNGLSKNEALCKARIFYKYLIGYHEMIKNKKQASDYLQEVKTELNQLLGI